MSNNGIPKHVAIIMDGNGRWAKQRGKPRGVGHKAGVDTLRDVVEYAAKRGVQVLSAFAFSTENWSRPQEEVGTLMRLFLMALKSEVKKLHKNNIRLSVIGDISKFSKPIREHIAYAEKLTKENTAMRFVIAANYGGRWDIVQAFKKTLTQVVDGQLTPEMLTETDITNALSTYDLPDPDLLIRTSGESRISNFFLWQLAYTELFFSNRWWPDFDKEAFEEAMTAYQQRNRRYGDVED